MLPELSGGGRVRQIPGVPPGTRRYAPNSLYRLLTTFGHDLFASYPIFPRYTFHASLEYVEQEITLY